MAQSCVKIYNAFNELYVVKCGQIIMQIINQLGTLFNVVKVKVDSKFFKSRVDQVSSQLQKNEKVIL